MSHHATPVTPAGGAAVAEPDDAHAHAAGHDDGHVHTFFDEDQFPAMHFEDAGQQKEAAAVGMWSFLATEVLLFAGLFLVYTIYRNWYHDGFVVGSHQLNVTLGTINTLVLLASSLCVALSIHKAQRNSSKGIVFYLALTIALGLTFFVVKGFEWHADYEEGLIPWMNWDQKWGVTEVNGQVVDHNYQVKLFMLLYFVMTGTHAVHMVVGMAILGVIAYKASRGRYNAKYYTPLELGGLYWHFVDIVWVFLVPTLYLIDTYSKGPGGHH